MSENIWRTGEYMLHILLTILKIILIIIGVVLGIVLALLLLLLFCPVRYKAEAQKSKEAQWKQTEIEAKVGWLSWLISFQIRFCDGKLEKKIKILGISLEKIKKGIQFVKSKKNKKKKKTQTNTVKKKEKKSLESKNAAGAKKKLSDQPARIETQIEKEPEKNLEKKPVEEQRKDEASQEISKKKRFQAIREKIQKLVKLPSILCEKLRNITSTIRRICDKISWFKNLLEHPRVQEWLSFVKTEVMKLLKHILPNKAKGYLIFGSEDPYITGSVLAVLGMTMPFHKNTVTVTPVFENENILEGNLAMKGRIYGFVLVLAAVKIYFHKNTKYIIRRWKNKEA